MLWKVRLFFEGGVTFGVAVEEFEPNSSDVLSCTVNEVDLNFWCCQFEHKQLSCSEA